MKTFVQFICSLFLLIGLYSFSEFRSADRLTADLSIELMNRTGSVLDQVVVNKLLIQKEEANLLAGGDRVALKKIEEEVGKIPSVSRVEAFRRFSGQVVVQVWTRVPIARISGKPSYLLDKDGVKLPLVEYRTARLPLVSGAVHGDRIEELCALITTVQSDPFMSEHIIGIDVEENGVFGLHTRSADYKVRLPGLDNLDHRIRNYKVFYQKAKSDSLLDDYVLIDLSCNNQVVCTKKRKDGRS